METLIKKAIEGGYKDITDRDDWQNRRDYIFQLVTLDPLFWQSLGKACGWKVMNYGYTLSNMTNQTHTDLGAARWKFVALRFHEINLTEGWDSAIKYLTTLVEKDN